jgi:SAM-dependent methyltransferase
MKICPACGGQFEADDFCCPACGHSPEVRDGHPTFAPELAAGYDGFKAGFFASLAELEEGNFWFESRNRLLTWALGRYFPNTESFLEIGCGTGFALSGIRREFQDIKLFGSDIFSEGFAYAKDRVPEATFFQMDAHQIPFEDEFDVIGAFDVLEHIKDDEAVLKQMYQACKHKGGIILTVPQHAFLWSYMDEYSCHVRRYRARELKMKVERAGFKVLRMTSFVSILLPLMIISRLKKRQPDPEFDPASELRISGLINTILERVIDLERSMIRLGLSFPAGGSLLLIARKTSGFVS